jgi:hypothetical protein
MENDLDQWQEIAAIIARDKKTAQDHLRSREFVPAALEAHPPETPFRRLARFPAFRIAAAFIALAVGLVSIWLLKGNWRIGSDAQALDELLSRSFLYNRGSRFEARASAAGPEYSAAPYFTAWAAAGLERVAAAAAEPVDLSVAAGSAAPVENGDPEEVRWRIGKVIRENMLEHLLTEFRGIHNKET